MRTWGWNRLFVSEFWGHLMELSEVCRHLFCATAPPHPHPLLFSFSLIPTLLSLHETHAVIPTHSHRHRGRERQEQNTGLADWRRIFFFLFLNEKELEKRHCKTKMWLPIFAFFLSLLCYCMLLFSSLLFPFPSFYLSLSLPLCISQAFRVCDFSCGRKWMDDIYFSLPALILLFRYCV